MKTVCENLKIIISDNIKMEKSSYYELNRSKILLKQKLYYSKNKLLQKKKKDKGLGFSIERKTVYVIF